MFLLPFKCRFRLRFPALSKLLFLFQCKFLIKCESTFLIKSLLLFKALPVPSLYQLFNSQSSSKLLWKFL
jgi:hypothetical protein